MKIEDRALMDYFWSWEVLRRLGFTPDELFMVATPPGAKVQDTPDAAPKTYDKAVIAIAVRRGGKEFLWIIGPTDVHIDELEAAYNAGIDAWNANQLEGATPEDFQKSIPFRNGARVMLALQRKGMFS